MDKDEIEFYSVKYWQENWDDLFARVEQGEIVGIDDEDSGHRAVMVPEGVRVPVPLFHC